MGQVKIQIGLYPGRDKREENFRQLSIHMGHNILTFKEKEPLLYDYS